MNDEIFDDEETLQVTNGVYTARLFNRKIAPVWIVTDNSKTEWQITFNPFSEENKYFVLDEIERKGVKVDNV